MKTEDIQIGDVLSCTRSEGAGIVNCRFYRVMKVNRVTVDVETEWGECIRVRATTFDRKASVEWPIMTYLE